MKFIYLFIVFARVSYFKLEVLMEIKFVLSNINYITVPVFTKLGDGLLGRSSNWSENEIDT